MGATDCEPKPTAGALRRTAERCPSRPALSRRSVLAAGAAAVALSTLSGCASPEAPLTTPPDPEPLDDLAHLRRGGDPIVAGEVLDGTLLRRFYARRGFEPVWTTRPALAARFAECVLRSADHGLDPDLFHASLLWRAAMFPPLRRELLLSHAVLAYAEALSAGGVPAGRRLPREDLLPEPVDVAAVLDRALESADPVGVIESLAPATETYSALREALRRHRSGAAAAPGAADPRPLIAANLERQRWLPRRLPADRVWVNVADQRLVVYRDDRPVFTTRVIVGEETERKQSPEFHAVIEGAFLNPPWIIPADIVAAEILPKLEEDPEFLARNGIALRPNGEAEQAPGPHAGLGVIMFDMPNRFNVYLHDTPDKTAFDRENRRLSNGCIRVEKPLHLAALLMGEPLEAIHERVATGETVRKPLREPVPVFVLYHTAFTAKDGRLEIRPDFYGRDVTLWRRLHKHAPEPRPPAAGQAKTSGRDARPRRLAPR